MTVPTLRTERLVLRAWTDADRAAMFAVNGDPVVMATIGPVMTRAESDAMVDRIIAAWSHHVVVPSVRRGSEPAASASEVSEHVATARGAREAPNGLSEHGGDRREPRHERPTDPVAPAGQARDRVATARWVRKGPTERGGERSEPKHYGLWCVDGGGRCIGMTGLSTPWFDAPFVDEIRATGQPCVEVGWRLASAHWGRGYATEAAQAALRHAFGELGLDQVVSFTAVTNQRSRRVMEKLGLRRDPRHDFEHAAVPPGHPLRPHVLYRLTRADAEHLPWRW